MSEKHDESGGAGTLWLAAAMALVLFFLPGIYVLSIGPVVAVVERADAGREVVQVIYAPVIWLHDHTALKEPLEAYARLWGWQ
jgi:hypothetical protein